MHRWLVECHVLRQDLKKLGVADPLSKAADRDANKKKENPTKINKTEINWQHKGCSGHTGRRWAREGFPGGTWKMHPRCQQGLPVSTSWTKLSLCWAFSRNPETLLLCFCPCYGQSGPSLLAPLLPCVPRPGCHYPVHPALTGWGLTLWHSWDAAGT